MRTKVLALSLCLVMALGIIAYAAPSEWARELVNEAIAENLVPQNLQSDFTQAITRVEFCALAVALYESLMGEITEITPSVTFYDTHDMNVEKMVRLGVVSGIGDNLFAPYNEITREQAAVLLSRLAAAIGYYFPRAREGQTADFVDFEQISYWAVDGVIGASLVGIMGGVSENRFDPQGPFTREQSIITMMRLREIIISQQTPYTPTPFDPPYIPYEDLPVPYEAGSVSVAADGALHMPFEHFFHGAGLFGGAMMSVSGLPFSFENAVAELTEIVLGDDFEIIITGDYASSVTFSLYDENFEAVFSMEETFTAPTEPGVFILCVDIIWRNDGCESPFAGFTAMRYAFKIRVK